MTQAALAPAERAATVAERRTFAIISHPDAGKTTVTEKLLLFGGAIQIAGDQTIDRLTIHTHRGSRHGQPPCTGLKAHRLNAYPRPYPARYGYPRIFAILPWRASNAPCWNEYSNRTSVSGGRQCRGCVTHAPRPPEDP
jgi:hypothetical protein